MSSELTREDAIKFLSGFLLLLGGGIYVNAFAGFWELDSLVQGFDWAIIDALIGGACLFGSYLAYKETKVRQYKAAFPYKLSEEHRQAIRENQKSILALRQASGEDELESRRKRKRTSDS